MEKQENLGESSNAVAKQQYRFSDLQASSVLLGQLEHPNKMPFSGVVTRFNVPSDAAPHGSGGRKVVIPSEVGVPALESLQGMAVNYVPDGWDGHSPTDKIGVIERAYAGDPEDDGAVPVYVEGYIYAHDFESAAIDIKLNQSALGFSVETAQTKLSAGVFGGEQVAMVADIGYFTGAAILLKSTAAWRTTALAAAEDDSVGKEELQAVGEEQAKAIMSAIEALREYVDTKLSVLQDRQWFDEMMQETYQRLDRADDAVSEAVEEIAEASGVDVNPEGGEVAVAASTEATEATEETPADGVALEVTDEVIQDETPEVDVPSIQAELQAARDEIATIRTQLDAARAEATSLQAAARKSVPYAGALVSKFGLNDEDDETRLMAEIDKRTDLSIEDRIAAKLELRDKRLKASK